MKTPNIRSDKINRADRGQPIPARDPKPRIDHATHDFAFGDNLETETKVPHHVGLDGLVHSALGPVNLPSALRLVAALESASDRVAKADSAVPGLSDLVRAVIDEEVGKINRYVTISGG